MRAVTTRNVMMLLSLVAVFWAARCEAESVVQAGNAVVEELPWIDGIIVMQHDQIQFSHFDAGNAANHLHEIRSAGKSVIALALGMALGEAKIQAVEMPVFSVFDRWLPDAEGDRARMTIADVLTMRSGIRCRTFGSPNNPCDPHALKNRLRWCEHLLSAMDGPPGERFSYNDMAPEVILALIYGVTGVDAWTYIRTQLFEPLGISSRGTLGKLSANDLLRIGQLTLQRGCWQGRQLVPEKWIARMTAAHHFFPVTEGRAGYGYFWWWRELDLEGEPLEVTFAAGNGGQLVMVIPALDAVVVTTGNAFDNMEKIWGITRAVYKKLIPAMTRTPSPPFAAERCLAAPAPR